MRQARGLAVDRFRPRSTRPHDEVNRHAKQRQQRPIPEIVRAAQKGIVHANVAARKVSRLNSRVKALQA